ncbi:MAG: hypothetical protein IJS17_00200 [Clostridia bacterium]|nr:hypothetical protein [Clostridia bacterium]
MADNRSCQFSMNPRSREPMCIDANRIYDSCCDKDCLADLRVTFPSSAQSVIDNASAVRCRKAEIINCCVDVEPLQFNKGCYSVDITYFFKLKCDLFAAACCDPTTVCGLATFTKTCVLFGSEGDVKVFTSDFGEDAMDAQLPCSNNNPRAKVQVVDPIVLDAKLCDVCECSDSECRVNIPAHVARQFDGNLARQTEGKAVKVTLGLFSIVVLERDAQILIPSAEYCIPKKECCFNSDDPCDGFKRINFPMSEFFPSSSNR